MILTLAIAALSTPVDGAAMSSAVPPARKPMRVMSLNQCTDQLVLALLPPARIASVTALSRDPETSLMYREARRVGVNHGLAEEVVRQKPDLVIAGSFSTPSTRAMLKRLGYPMIEVGGADSFDAIRDITRQVAKAVGESARGEAMIARMDAKLATLARSPGPPLRVAAWDGAGFTAGEGSLYDTVLKAAGAINVTNQPPAIYGKPDTEALLATAPTLLVKGAGVRRKPGLHDNVERHPLVRRYWDGDRTITIRQAYYICGTPRIAEAVFLLRRELRTAAARIRTPLPFAATRPR